MVDQIDGEQIAARVASEIRKVAEAIGRDPLAVASLMIVAQERSASFGFDRLKQPDFPAQIVSETFSR